MSSGLYCFPDFTEKKHRGSEKVSNLAQSQTAHVVQKHNSN